MLIVLVDVAEDIYRIIFIFLMMTAYVNYLSMYNFVLVFYEGS